MNDSEEASVGMRINCKQFILLKCVHIKRMALLYIYHFLDSKSVKCLLFLLYLEERESEKKILVSVDFLNGGPHGVHIKFRNVEINTDSIV